MVLRPNMSCLRRSTEKLVDSITGQIAAVGIDVQCADLDIADFAGEAGAGIDRDDLSLFEPDPPAEKHGRNIEVARLGEIEITPAFKEKIPLLRKEQIESGEVYLAFVDFDLWNLLFGSNIRLLDGTELQGTKYAFYLTPVVGIKLATLAQRIPIIVEVEFLGDERPVKVALVASWR